MLLPARTRWVDQAEGHLQVGEELIPRRSPPTADELVQDASLVRKLCVGPGAHQEMQVSASEVFRKQRAHEEAAAAAPLGGLGARVSGGGDGDVGKLGGRREPVPPIVLAEGVGRLRGQVVLCRGILRIGLDKGTAVTEHSLVAHGVAEASASYLYRHHRSAVEQTNVVHLHHQMHGSPLRWQHRS